MSNALKRVKLSRCRCGGHPVMNERVEYSGNYAYSVYCNHCGKKTSEYYWMSYATRDWERMNKAE